MGCEHSKSTFQFIITKVITNRYDHSLPSIITVVSLIQTSVHSKEDIR